MAREPAGRYTSVKHLADDLRAYLEGRVVSAYESGPWAELRKWVRRNRALASALAATVLAVVTGLVAVAVVQRRANVELTAANDRTRAAKQRVTDANDALRAANDQVTRTNRELSLTNERLIAAGEEVRVESAARERVGELLLDMFAQAAPHVHGGEIPDAVGVLEIGARTLARGEQDPRVAGLLATQLGLAFESLGEQERALELAREAAESYVTAFGPDSPEVLEAEMLEAHALTNLGRYDEALELARGARERGRRALGDGHALAGRFASVIGFNLAQLGRAEESLDALYEALDVLSALPQQGEALLHRQEVAVVLGRSLLRVGDVEGAVATLAEACEALGDVGDTGEAARFLEEAQLSYVEALRFAGDSESALEILELVLERHERIHEPGTRRLRQDRIELALLLAETGRIEEAVATLEDVRLEELDVSETPLFRARTAIHLARVLTTLGRADRVREVLTEHGVAVTEGEIDPRSPEGLGIVLELARNANLRGKPDEALELAERLIETTRVEDPGAQFLWIRAYAHHEVAGAHESRDRLHEAAAAWDAARDTWAAMGPSYDSGVRMARDNAARVRAAIR